MALISGLTPAQSKFLRGFATGQTAPSGKDWPRVSLLEQWLKEPQFRKRFHAVTKSMSREIRLRLLAKAVAVSRRIGEMADPSALKPGEMKECMDLIRLALMQDRTADRRRKPIAKDRDDDENATFEELAGRLAHPLADREQVIQFLKNRAQGMEKVDQGSGRV